jgi:hypothetical protein
MANMFWTKCPNTVIQDYNARHGQNLSSPLFRWATFVVEELYYLDDLDSNFNIHPNSAGSHNPDVIDMAHGRWAVGSAITALDLCAAALGRQYYKQSTQDQDLRQLNQWLKGNAGRRSKFPLLARQWVDNVLNDSCYKIVLEARHSLTHSRLLRHLHASIGGESNMDRMDFKITIDNNQIQVGVRDLVLQSRDLAAKHVDRFLRVFDTL